MSTTANIESRSLREMIDNVASLDFLNVYLSLLVRSFRARELGLPAVCHRAVERG
jgi:hypothetical protein